MLIRLLLFHFLAGVGILSAAQPGNEPAYSSSADSTSRDVYTTIRSISIVGNRTTKTHIVEREIAFENGKTYLAHDLARRIRLSKEQLMNTLLFIGVEITTVEAGIDLADIQIRVRERWYLFPFPYFKVIDRNWNEWINTYGASLSRVNYGLKVSENNLTGRNDKLNLWLIGGYTRQVSFNYTQPYLDKNLKHGMFLGFQYARTREVNYATNYDTLKFFKLPVFARTVITGNIGYSYRKGSRERHNIRFSLSRDKVDTAISKLNPDFFGNGSSHAVFADLTYNFQYFNVDYIRYPLRGWYADVYATKRFGHELGNFSIGGKFLKSWKILKGTYFMLQAIGSVKLPFDQPYYNARLLGYGDLAMRGLEYVVVDGVAGGCLKSTARKKVLEFSIKNFIKKKSTHRIPFTFYAKVFADMGYVYSRNAANNSRLANKFIRSGGFGLDIMTIYDLILKLDFSFNQLGSSGLYYHTGSDF